MTCPTWTCPVCRKPIVGSIDPERIHRCPRMPKEAVPWVDGETAQARYGMVIEGRQAGGLPDIKARHLLYHIYPGKANDLWRDNIDQLLQRIDVFNGRRIASVGVDETTHPFEMVQELLAPYDIECRQFRNDRWLREVVAFLPMISECQDMEHDEAVWYGHTKGNATNDDPRGAVIWRNIGYHRMLTDWEEAMQLLKTHAAVGMHKMVWAGRRSPYPSGLKHGRWMLAGTFFWFRPAITHAYPDWRNVPVDRYGAEAWLGGLIPGGAAASMYQVWHEQTYPTPSPYDPMTYPEADRERFGGELLGTLGDGGKDPERGCGCGDRRLEG